MDPQASDIGQVLSSFNIPDELKNKAYSDVYFEQDGNKIYFVDLVMEGGGMLGLGLVGYTYVLEQCNIRFRKVAGASAGAINAIGISAAGTPDQQKTPAIARMLDEVAFFSFVDGPSNIRTLIQNFNKSGLGHKVFRFTIGAASAVVRLFKKRGLNPGDAFYQWMENKILKPFNAVTVAQLEQKWVLPEDIELVYPDRFAFTKGQEFSDLAVKASCMSIGVEVTFPKHKNLFYRADAAVPVTDFARASMSVPIFFDPFILKDIPSYQTIMGQLQTEFSHTLMDPAVYGKEATFVDGGLMSNFPFDEFHAPVGIIPSMPTFGAKLGFDVDRFDNGSLLKYLTNMVDIAKGNSDREYRHTHYADYSQVVKEIDTTGIAWLDFDMSPEDKKKLVENGCKAAVEFLQSFDWEQYKQLREQQSKVLLSSLTEKGITS
ncbi:patatin-like phospholipase family protein [Alteromonas sp. C1M14]|uniref:patatin-like phospholipase family protein n=1 Tax=Alteromonas sp. C1M14 TaxID=2841567 RepID=UPI001C09E674|nr:patatin-like phospholipase family protein [Alteromonas sp. C1M14]MBU2978187.1 patatin-like phospholipase family protein [Alteromonas sp. C1M14]